MHPEDFEINSGELTAYVGRQTHVIVPDNVTRIAQDAFFECSFVQSVKLPEGVKSVGKRAFWGCEALESIELPTSLRSIEDNAFRSCGSLREITLPEGLTYLGEAVFRACGQLESALLPDSLTKLEISTFSDCFALKNVRLSPFTETIGVRCFHWCVSLESIDLPDSLKELDNELFLGCMALQSVQLPDQLETIGSKCFSECKKLNALDVPPTLTNIGADAFYKSGVLINCTEDFFVLGQILVKYNGSSETAAVPRKVRTVSSYAFADCEQLVSVTLPETVVSIADYAFENCSSLENAALPQSLKSIGKGAFSQCPKLVMPTLPPSLEHIGANVFDISQSEGMTVAAGKYLLSFTGTAETLTLPKGLTVIADEAFVRCFVGEVTIPEGAVTIGSAAFRWRSELKKVTIPDTVRYIGDSAFANCGEPLIVINEPGGELGDNAFPKGTKLELNVHGQQVRVTLVRDVRQGSCAERQLWNFACSPSEQTFVALELPEYKLPCAIAFYSSTDYCKEYLKKNITQAVCYAAEQQDGPLLEKVLSYRLLDLEQLRVCIDFAVQHKLTQQQVVLMRCRHEQFDAQDAAAKRFEL